MPKKTLYNRFAPGGMEGISSQLLLAARLYPTSSSSVMLVCVQFRDLRRTCVVYLGELGMDAHLIASVTGHDIDETQRILKTYIPRTTGRAARVMPWPLPARRRSRPEGKGRALLKQAFDRITGSL